MKMVIYRQVMDDVEIDVTEEDIRRGVVHIECPACEGTGVAFWHPEFPDREPRPSDRDTKFGCVECSTRGERAVTVG